MADTHGGLLESGRDSSFIFLERAQVPQNARKQDCIAE
jgi:hypothetical protein